MTIRANDLWGTANSCSWTKQEGESMIFHQILNRIHENFRVDRNDVWRWGIYITRLYRKTYCIEIKRLENTKVVFGRQVEDELENSTSTAEGRKNIHKISNTLMMQSIQDNHVHEKHQENVLREQLSQTSKDDKRELDNIWRCNFMLDMWILTEEIQRSST